MKKTIIVLVFALLATGCSNLGDGVNTSTANKKDLSSQSTSIPSTKSPQPVKNEIPKIKKEVYEASLAAIGDILIHSPIYKAAQTKEGGYNFKPIFTQVKPVIEEADIAIANQETMIGGKELGLSSYPSFNSPHEVGDALKDIGVDIVTLANNHTLDRGEKAIQSALAYWDKIEMPYVGSYKNMEDRNQIRIIEKNNIKFAFLSYTYGTNGIPVPKGKPYLVNLINMEAIKTDVAAARKIADVVIVSTHFGVEYARTENENQRSVAQQLSDMGVDIIIGHHPHVLQPPSWITNKNGKKTFVVYSLGNFISSQEGVYKRIGGVMKLKIVKTVEGNNTKIDLIEPSFLPTYGYYLNYKNYSVLPLETIGDKLLPESRKYFDDITKHMRTYIRDLKIDSVK